MSTKKTDSKKVVDGAAKFNQLAREANQKAAAARYEKTFKKLIEKAAKNKAFDLNLSNLNAYDVEYLRSIGFSVTVAPEFENPNTYNVSWDVEE